MRLLIKQFVRVAILKLGTFLFLYPTAILVSRTLGPDGYGKYGLITAVVPLLSVLVLSGLDQSIVKNIGKKGLTFVTNNYFFLVRYSLFHISIGFIIVLSLAACLIFWFEPTDDNLIIVAAIAVLFPLQSLRKIFSSVIRSLKKPELAQVPDSIIQPGSFFIFVLITFLTLEHINLLLVLVCLFFSSLFAFLFALWKTPNKQNIYLDSQSTKRRRIFFFTTLPFLGLTISNEIVVYADRIMIVFIDGYHDAGVYLIAARNAALLTTAVGSIQFVIGPHIAKMKLKSDTVSLQKLCKLHILCLLGVSIPLALGMSFYVDDILRLFGDEYSGAKLALLVLISGYTISFFFGASVQYLFMGGDAKTAFKLTLSACAINIVLNLILIPILGIVGAATATAISEVYLKMASCVIMYRRKLVHTSILALLK